MKEYYDKATGAIIFKNHQTPEEANTDLKIKELETTINSLKQELQSLKKEINSLKSKIK